MYIMRSKIISYVFILFILGSALGYANPHHDGDETTGTSFPTATSTQAKDAPQIRPAITSTNAGTSTTTGTSTKAVDLQTSEVLNTLGETLSMDAMDAPACETVKNCQTVEDLNHLIDSAQAKIEKLQSAAPLVWGSLTWGNIVKKDKDSRQYCLNNKNISTDVCLMEEYAAELYCYKHNKRLPTVTELAQWAQDNGAQGIAEPFPTLNGLPIDNEIVATEISWLASKNYVPIFKKNNWDQKTVYFYFNSEGYKIPSKDLKGYSTWSLSLSPDFDSDKSGAYVVDGAYVMDMNHAFIVSDSRISGQHAVRCVSGGAVQ